jgi:hypothetical protein
MSMEPWFVPAAMSCLVSLPARYGRWVLLTHQPVNCHRLPRATHSAKRYLCNWAAPGTFVSVYQISDQDHRSFPVNSTTLYTIPDELLNFGLVILTHGD